MLHTFGNAGNPVLLLLHGIGAGPRMWRRQIDRFEATHFVVAPDIPGLTGTPPDEQIDIPTIASWLDRQLRQQGIREFSVCGISAGASVALALALALDDGVAINHLVLSAPQVRAPRIMFGLQIAVCSAIPETLLMKTAARPYEGDREIAEVALRDCRTLGKAGLLKAMRALWRLDLRSLSLISTPTLVMCGAKDRVNIPAARRIASAIPRAKLHVELDAGHLWNIDNPTRFNAVLADALIETKA